MGRDTTQAHEMSVILYFSEILHLTKRHSCARMRYKASQQAEAPQK